MNPYVFGGVVFVIIAVVVTAIYFATRSTGSSNASKESDGSDGSEGSGQTSGTQSPTSGQTSGTQSPTSGQTSGPQPPTSGPQPGFQPGPAPFPAPSPESLEGGPESSGLSIGAWIGIGFGGLAVLVILFLGLRKARNVQLQNRQTFRMGLSKQAGDNVELSEKQLAALFQLANENKWNLKDKNGNVVDWVKLIQNKYPDDWKLYKETAQQFLDAKYQTMPLGIKQTIQSSAVFRNFAQSYQQTFSKRKMALTALLKQGAIGTQYRIEDKKEGTAFRKYMSEKKIRDSSFAIDKLLESLYAVLGNPEQPRKTISKDLEPYVPNAFLVADLIDFYKKFNEGRIKINNKVVYETDTVGTLALALYILAGTYKEKTKVFDPDATPSDTTKAGFAINPNLIALNRLREDENTKAYDDVLKFRDCNTPDYLEPDKAFGFPKNKDGKVPARRTSFFDKSCPPYQFSQLGEAQGSYRRYARNYMEPVLKRDAARYLGAQRTWFEKLKYGRGVKSPPVKK
jgi:hypothetical protein